jgi:hypothetical protein
MYSMVLMAAMLPSGDAAGFGKKNNGCNGGCHGTVAAAGCTGYAAPAGCTGAVASGCCGGSRGGFLGLHNRGNSCSGGGFLGHKHKGNSCNGGGCSGYAAPAGCNGGGIVVQPVAPAPVAMPPKM